MDIGYGKWKTGYDTWGKEHGLGIKSTEPIQSVLPNVHPNSEVVYLIQMDMVASWFWIEGVGCGSLHQCEHSLNSMNPMIDK